MYLTGFAVCTYEDEIRSPIVAIPCPLEFNCGFSRPETRGVILENRRRPPPFIRLSVVTKLMHRRYFRNDHTPFLSYLARAQGFVYGRFRYRHYDTAIITERDGRKRLIVDRDDCRSRKLFLCRTNRFICR